MFRTFTTAAVLALTITAAQANDVVTVHFGDLNLSNAGDAQVLAGRIYTAAASACAALEPDRSDQSRFYRSMYEHCISRVSQNTSAKVLAVTGQPRKFANK